jgi:hypothetical protein
MKKGLFVRLSDEEIEILRQYCMQVERTQSDVIREFVRRLKKKIPDASMDDSQNHVALSLLNLRQQHNDSNKSSRQ